MSEERKHGPYNHETLLNADDSTPCKELLESVDIDVESLTLRLKAIEEGLIAKYGKETLSSHAIEMYENSDLTRRELAFLSVKWMQSTRAQSPIQQFLNAIGGN